MANSEGKTIGQEQKRCFIIMPISDVDGYLKGHFDRVYEYIIAPACQKAGYEVIRADGTAKANVIIADILKNVLECEMAICDLSARNPNVFYELGFRQAFNKKTVLMIDDKTDRPFDISGLRSFQYDSSLRIDLVNKAIDDLVKALKETSDMGEHELNSLLKLLSIENPATLPEGHKLSDESTLILQAIRELGEDVHRGIRRRSVFTPLGSPIIDVSLPNGKKVKVGDRLFDMKHDKDLGEVVELTKDSTIVKNINNDIDIILQDSPIFKDLMVMPF